ncbi:leucine-rich repeat protein [Plasmodium brasilianum]|uniref:Leucine-rich repeat protein, putative n=3 Tax=Plasmodium (Plasmodium) TaxID=418103 RepID=A0A1D3JJI7_PLAMA|nr:leucine-rich repeat protein, putative [Plasmodium malariae]KAI4839728.1 leucine-rich repeat protein [Plasmodium brasilianum]SBT86670.1 leucine-rich repeat protein, putative [Plasmodium malariae]
MENERTIVEGSKSLMCYKDIKKICSENNLYETDELNEVLYLHMKGFHNIDGLSTFKNLKCLFLNNNCIRKIDNLNALTNLKALYLQNNDITKIENIECSSLVILNLSNNKIKKISNLQPLKSLQTLNISNNLLENIDDIKEIANLENLTHLDLSNNNLNFNNDKDIPDSHDHINKSGNNDDEKRVYLNEVKWEQMETYPSENESKNKFTEFINFYKNFHEEVNKNENYDYVKYHQNVEIMDALTKKKFFFLCEFIILLKKVKKLKTLFVKNNPFSNKIRHVSRYLIANIPRLVFLDDKKIKKEDVCLARIFLKRGTKEEHELKKIFEKKKIDKYKNLTEKFHSFLLAKSEKV